MIRFAYIMIALALTGCTQSTRGGPVRDTLIAQWRECLAASYVSNRRGGVEKNLAAESAFMACMTEERAIVAPFAYDPQFYFEATQVIAAQKPSIKAQLMSAG